MRFDIGLVHGFCRVAPFDDKFGFGEPGLDIALGKANHLGDVRRFGRPGFDP